MATPIRYRVFVFFNYNTIIPPKPQFEYCFTAPMPQAKCRITFGQENAASFYEKSGPRILALCCYTADRFPCISLNQTKIISCFGKELIVETGTKDFNILCIELSLSLMLEIAAHGLLKFIHREQPRFLYDGAKHT